MLPAVDSAAAAFPAPGPEASLLPTAPAQAPVGPVSPAGDTGSSQTAAEVPPPEAQPSEAQPPYVLPPAADAAPETSGALPGGEEGAVDAAAAAAAAAVAFSQLHTHAAAGGEQAAGATGATDGMAELPFSAMSALSLGEEQGASASAELRGVEADTAGNVDASNSDDPQEALEDVDGQTSPQPGEAPPGVGDEFGDGPELHVKLLISQSAAGVIIGKGGSTILDLQAGSGASLRLSRHKQFYPGTLERVCLMHGPVKSVLTAIYLILHRLVTLRGKKMPQASNETWLKLVCPTSACKELQSGKNGNSLASFASDSGANIKCYFLPNDPDGELPHEAVIAISGSLRAILRALALLLSQVAHMPEYACCGCTRIATRWTRQARSPATVAPSPRGGSTGTDAAAAGMTPPGMPQQVMGAQAVAMQHAAAQAHAAQAAGIAAGMPSAAMMHGVPAGSMQGGTATTMTLMVPDTHITAVCGHDGEVLTMVSSLLMDAVRITLRHDPFASTGWTCVEVMGSALAVPIAYMLLRHRWSVVDGMPMLAAPGQAPPPAVPAPYGGLHNPAS